MACGWRVGTQKPWNPGGRLWTAPRRVPKWEEEISQTEPEGINVMFTWKTTDNIQHVLRQHF